MLMENVKHHPWNHVACDMKNLMLQTSGSNHPLNTLASMCSVDQCYLNHFGTVLQRSIAELDHANMLREHGALFIQSTQD